MENIQTKSVQEEVEKAMQQHILTRFGSEEGMKTFYLQLANILRVTLGNPPIGSECIRLKKLSKKIGQYGTLLQALGDHKWEKGAAEIQQTLGIYMMQNDIDSKVRRQINMEIASQLQFIVYLAGNTTLIKQLQGLCDIHLSNLKYLLESISAQSQDIE